MMLPDPRRALAFHSAAHAITLLQYGFVFDRVEVSERRSEVHIDPPVTLIAQKDREEFAVIALCGPVAEYMYAGYDAKEWRRRQLECWSNDYENALVSCPDWLNASLEVIGSFIARTERRASELVRYFWPSIIMLAGVLDREGRVSFRQVAELMKGNA